MEQQTGPKSGKEYVKTVYCQPAYLTWFNGFLKFYRLHIIMIWNISLHIYTVQFSANASKWLTVEKLFLNKLIHQVQE